MSDTTKGPQSYFPSIEKTYGHPIAHWFELLAPHTAEPHMGMVTFLKEKHNIGHGHANALVAYYRAHGGRLDD